MAFEELMTVGFWSYMAISSVISAIAIYVGSKLMKTNVSVVRAFVVAIAANVISYFGIMGIVAGLLPIPFAYMIASALVWILLIKFILNTNFMHAVVIGIVAFVVSYVLGLAGITTIINSLLT